MEMRDMVMKICGVWRWLEWMHCNEKLCYRSIDTVYNRHTWTFILPSTHNISLGSPDLFLIYAIS
jgi:hypothetical protein